MRSPNLGKNGILPNAKSSLPQNRGSPVCRSRWMRRLLIWPVLGLLFLAGCSTTAKEQTPDSKRELVRPNRPQQDIRQLRSAIPGQPMREVVRRLGQPDRVFTAGEREVWVYRDAAADPVTEKPVSWIEVVFENRRAREIDFGY